MDHVQWQVVLDLELLIHDPSKAESNISSPLQLTKEEGDVQRQAVVDAGLHSKICKHKLLPKHISSTTEFCSILLIHHQLDA